MDFVQVISTIGFPAAMCAWFMWKTDTLLINNTAALTELKDAVNDLCLRK